MLRLDDERRRALLVDRQWVGAPAPDAAPADVVRAVGPLHATDPSTAYLRIAAWFGDVRVSWRYPTPLQRSLELE